MLNWFCRPWAKGAQELGHAGIRVHVHLSQIVRSPDFECGWRRLKSGGCTKGVSNSNFDVIVSNKYGRQVNREFPRYLYFSDADRQMGVLDKDNLLFYFLMSLMHEIKRAYKCNWYRNVTQLWSSVIAVRINDLSSYMVDMSLFIPSWANDFEYKVIWRNTERYSCSIR